MDRKFDYAVGDSLRDVVRVGTLVAVRFGNRNVRAVVVEIEERPADPALESIARAVVSAPLAPIPLTDLYEWLALRYVVPRGRAFARAVPPRVRVKATVGDIRITETTSALPSYGGGAALLDAIRAGNDGVWCVRPVGADDREDLVGHLISASIEASGGAAIVTVPEVGYGAPLLDRLERDHPSIVRMDSFRSDADRSTAWVSMAEGAPIGGGGRASVFAPAPSLRLILVDEEHHPAYKEERSPRYDARRVALKRADLQGAACVFITATPTVETGWELLGGRWAEVAPDRSQQKEARPVVEVAPIPHDRTLGRAMYERIKDALSKQKRVALLATARGYARTLWCAECRRSLRCPVCEAAVSFDRHPASGRSRVRCPRCDFVGGVPQFCPTCGSNRWRHIGAGAERLEEQVAKAFPHSSVARVDPDALPDGRGDFADSDIYVTTWIGTKAAIRPPVSFVGVLNADALIRRADFRSAERAYHALAEMAAWAGPSNKGGRLLVQSDEPAHHAIQAVARADYHYFLEKEIEQRRELRYPPFSELIHVTAFGPGSARLAKDVAERARANSGLVLGPMVKTRTQNGGRAELLIKCEDADKMGSMLRPLAADVAMPDRLRVDVDPVSWTT
ncbi:MAG: primosomal protein N' [Actinomycetota bacterium]|nr:primosomal protein N' [Actinomycetota bacterium]